MKNKTFYALIVALLLSLIVIVTYLRRTSNYKWNELIDSTLLSLIPNLLILLFTLLIINKLINNIREKNLEKKYIRFAGDNHMRLTRFLEERYMAIIRKEHPVIHPVSEQDFNLYFNKIDIYINKEIFTTPIIFDHADNIYEHINYDTFYLDYFKGPALEKINKQIEKYYLIMPEDVLNKLLSIEKTFSAHEKALGIPSDEKYLAMNNNFQPNENSNLLQELRKFYKKLGKEIKTIKKYDSNDEAIF